MRPSAEAPVDVDVLRHEIEKTYTEVSTAPEHDFIFPTGRAWAQELGYPEPELDRVPEASAESFAGVANHWQHRGRPGRGGRARPRLRRRYRPADRRADDRAIRASDRDRHDDRDARSRAHERDGDGAGQRRASRVADRRAPTRRRLGRRGDLQRGHRPRTRQGRGVRRDRPRPATRRPAAARRRLSSATRSQRTPASASTSGPAELPALSWKESTRGCWSRWATETSSRASPSTHTPARSSRTPAARPPSSGRWARPSAPPSRDRVVAF